MSITDTPLGIREHMVTSWRMLATHNSKIFDKVTTSAWARHNPPSEFATHTSEHSINQGLSDAKAQILKSIYKSFNFANILENLVSRVRGRFCSLMLGNNVVMLAVINVSISHLNGSPVPRYSALRNVANIGQSFEILNYLDTLKLYTLRIQSCVCLNKTDLLARQVRVSSLGSGYTSCYCARLHSGLCRYFYGWGSVLTITP